MSFSSAMHSLIGLSPTGEPLTGVLTWADTRAQVQAERLRASAAGLALHRRTGTPLHPMSPLPKLVWFREQEPKLCEGIGFWVGIKEFVLSRICGALVVDYSVASATGLLNMNTLAWDEEALAIAGVLPEQLPEVVPTTTVLPGLIDDAAASYPLWRQLLADTFGMPVEFARGQEGSGFGAALLGMEALGLIESIDVVTDMVQIEETVRPQPAAAAVYASLLPIFSELYNALVPTFTSLRRLAPLLPIDLDLAEDSAAPEA